MRIIKVEIAKDHLLSIPEAEYSFFLSLGHMYNEINAITKLMYWAANTDAESEAESHGKTTLLVLFIRLLAGKLHEGWELLQGSFFGAALSRDYEPLLKTEAAIAMKSVKRYFSGGKAPATQIRHHFGFHYTPDEVSALLPHVEEKLMVYLDPEGAPNNLFYAPEALLAQAVIELARPGGDTNAVSSLVSELFDVSEWFSQVADGLMDAIIEKNGKELRAGDSEPLDLEGLIDFENVKLPWFTNTFNTSLKQEARLNTA